MFTVVEHDDNGETHALTASRIVDVNSRLSIRIAPDVLRQRLAAAWGEAHVDAAVLQAIAGVQDDLAALQAALPAFEAALEEWREVFAQSAAEQRLLTVDQIPARLREAIAQLAAPTTRAQDTLDRLFPEFDERFSRALRQAAERLGDGDHAVFWRTASEFLAEQEAAALRALQEAGAFVVFGAWSDAGGRTQPIHLPGFDVYPPGERHVVERFSVPLDAAQAAQWKAAVEQAKRIEAAGADDLLRLRSLARSLIANLDQALGKRLAELREALLTARDAVPAEESRRAVADTLQVWQQFHDRLQQLEGKYSAEIALADLATTLLAMRADVEGLITDATRLVNAVEKVALAIRAAAGAAAAALEAVAKDLREAAKRVLEQLGQTLGVFGEAKRLLDVTLRFGEEVLRLDVANVPTETELDLRDTGRRAAGDSLLLRMATGRRAEPERTKVVAQVELRMHRVLSHLVSAIGIDFANPRGRANLQNRFQAAPAYNLLLKAGSRESRFWNEFLSPGVGLNLAALDFDRDDTPELGVGLGVSLFRDWVQAGYGYDFGDDRGYWYVGLSLPFATFPLSGTAAR